MNIRPHSKNGSVSKGSGKRNRTHLAVMLGAALIALLTFVGLSMRAVHVGASAQSDLSESAVRQINALIAEKESRTPAQQKIDSQLLYAAKMDRGEEIAEGIRTLDVKVAQDLIRKSGRVDAGPLVDDSNSRDDLALKNDESLATVDISGRIDGALLWTGITGVPPDFIDSDQS
jgi:hypothetical protein